MSDSSILENGSKPRLLLLGNRRCTVPTSKHTDICRSGKSSIQRVVFHKMQPNETLFLESTTKITKDNIKYLLLLLLYAYAAHLSTSKSGIFPARSTFLIRRLLSTLSLVKWEHSYSSWTHRSLPRPSPLPAHALTGIRTNTTRHSINCISRSRGRWQ